MILVIDRLSTNGFPLSYKLAPGVVGLEARFPHFVTLDAIHLLWRLHDLRTPKRPLQLHSIDPTTLQLPALLSSPHPSLTPVPPPPLPPAFPAPPNPKLPIRLANESPTASTAPFGLLKLIISPCLLEILNSLILVPAHRPLLPRLFWASCAKMKPHSMDMYQPRAREDQVKVWRRIGGGGGSVRRIVSMLGLDGGLILGGVVLRKG